MLKKFCLAVLALSLFLGTVACTKDKTPGHSPVTSTTRTPSSSCSPSNPKGKLSHQVGRCTYLLWAESSDSERPIQRGTAFSVKTDARTFLLSSGSNIKDDFRHITAKNDYANLQNLRIAAKDEHTNIVLLYSPEPVEEGLQLFLGRPNIKSPVCSAGYKLSFSENEDDQLLLVEGLISEVETDKKGDCSLVNFELQGAVPSLGCPLLNEEGQVLGISSFRNTKRGLGLGLAASSQTIKNFLHEHQEALKAVKGE